MSGSTVRTALRITTPEPAVNVTGVETKTWAVRRGKEAWVAPAGTVTPAGAGAAAGLLLDRAMALPTGAAGQFSLIVPVETCPPQRLVGLSATPARSG